MTTADRNQHQRRIGFPGPERSLAQLLVGALLALLVLLLIMVAGVSVLLYFATDLLEMLSPPPIVRTPGM